MRKTRLILILIFLFGVISPKKIKENKSKNGKLGSTDLQFKCTSQSIKVSLKVPENFRGLIYTLGNFKSKEKYCFIDAETLPNQNTYRLEIPLNGCKTKKKGAKFSNTLIVQHDRDLITANDTAFKLICNIVPKKLMINLKAKLN